MADQLVAKLQQHRTTVGMGAGFVGSLALLKFMFNQLEGELTKERGEGKTQVFKKEQKQGRVAVDGRFLRKFRRLLPILVPRLLSPETGWLLLAAGAMVARTLCDIWMINNGTSIERSIIGRDQKGFLRYLGFFVLSFVPVSLVNNLLKYGLWKIQICFRNRLTQHLLTQYMTGFTYYKTSIDNRISNADQLLTQDVEKFATSVSDLYSNMSKPLLDIAVYAYKLASAVGVSGPLSMLVYLVFSGALLTSLRRPLGRLTVTEQLLEGDYRFVNSRLITNCEEVAFYNGSRKELAILNNSWKQLYDHLIKSLRFRFTAGVIDSILGKYFATVVGYFIVSRPFLNLADPRHANTSHAERMEDYYRSGRLLVGMASSVGRLVLSGRELNRLAGFTQRVSELMDVLKDLNAGNYARTMVASGDSDLQLKPNSGRVMEMDNVISFKDVPLVTPNGDVLVKGVTFEIKSGMNLMVCGPNGCGKSSLFRALGGLWPLFGGELVKPQQKNLFYVPQRPYMCLGSLRDQVIYPHLPSDMAAAGFTDADLLELLDQVQLKYIVEREGGWDKINDWMDVLSGGEKQRMAMARLFYHKPQFAILDECTSAVSVDVEGFIYARAREVGITLVTVSHRKSLWKYHEFVLSFDGRGAYEFKKMNPDDEPFGS